MSQDKHCPTCNGSGRCQSCKGSGHFGYPGWGPLLNRPTCNACCGSGTCHVCRGTGEGR